MSLVLSVDGDRWRAHLRSVAEAMPGLVPVIKGNGYGLSPGRLARRASWLAQTQGGFDTVAVGTYEELPEIASRFAGDLLVLTPWRPGVAVLEPALARRVLHTVSRPADLPALLAVQRHARYVLELMTSMRRHGMSAAELWSLAAGMPQANRMAGVALHLPLNSTTGSGSHLAEVERLITDVIGADLPATSAARTLWVSHLSAGELSRLRSAYADLVVRPRTGTDLWLGDRGALRVTSTVLDVHALERGQTFGYRGRSAPRDGHLLVVSGGTAHGIGLEAPQAQGGLRTRAATVARGGLDAVGLVRSPFWVDGKQRLFAEPPHMQVSMLFVPAGVRLPAIGATVEARVRFTATTFDRVDVV